MVTIGKQETKVEQLVASLVDCVSAGQLSNEMTFDLNIWHVVSSPLHFLGKVRQSRPRVKVQRHRWKITGGKDFRSCMHIIRRVKGTVG